MSDEMPADLVRHIAVSTGLPAATAARVVSDVIAYFDEPVGQYVRRRHAELKRSSHTNDEIWVIVSDELRARPFAATAMTERQLRRIVYG